MWHEYIAAASVAEVLEVLAERQEKARIIAGATDLILEIERGIRRGIETVVDITRIPDLNQIHLDQAGILHVGPLVTHNQIAASKLMHDFALPLAQAAWEVGSPQIRNRGTLAGNVITASPANDTITPLMALGAQVALKSTRGQRVVPIAEFYTGVRRTVMQPDEMLVEINFPAMPETALGTFVKFALRRAQAISLLNITAILHFDGDVVSKAQITLGAVAPTIVHAGEAEAFLEGKCLEPGVIQEAAQLATKAARPISDVRSTAAYRKAMIGVVTRRALTAIAHRDGLASLPENPVLLWGKENGAQPVLPLRVVHREGDPIVTRINGKPYTFTTGQEKTLLRLLREEAGLTGTKEGCAEGECGACTVYLDGEAVMSCMVGAPRAHGAEIVTVEGLAVDGELHPIQQAFIEAGAVQCGYCTPGFLMSAAKLLEERPTPSQDEIRQALTGNLCRCTGYYKIIEAVERASRR